MRLKEKFSCTDRFLVSGSSGSEGEVAVEFKPNLKSAERPSDPEFSEAGHVALDSFSGALVGIIWRRSQLPVRKTKAK